MDIQPIACQIAKLRFFIALIVDQSVDPSEPNYGILPLPNLETKVVAADTLLGFRPGQLRLDDERVRRIEEELKQVRHDYFTVRRYRHKRALRARDRELCADLASMLADSGDFTPYDTQRIAEWNPYRTNTHASFFDPAWMFGLHPADDQDGGVFDIVIGNPPYVRQEQLRGFTVTGSDGQPRPLKQAFKERYECYTGTADLYVYFFERSLQLLRVGGVLSFITSKWYEIQDTIDYWREFEQAKIIVPAIEDDVNYAPDSAMHYSNDKTSILIPSSVPYTLAITNSAVSWWITRQQFASRQGGFYEFKPMYVSQLPMPAASTEQRRWCEKLAKASIWLHGLDTAGKASNAPVASMQAYFEQWLNGLVYELFLSDELHGRKFTLFEETSRLNPPDLSTMPEPQKLIRLRELFEQAYDSQATLRSMLFSLRSLEVVRIIEEPLEHSVVTTQDRAP